MKKWINPQFPKIEVLDGIFKIVIMNILSVEYLR